MNSLMTRQFRVLYRDFLFRIVDRELLSTYASGDASQLLLQIVAALAFLSLCFSVPVLTIDPTWPALARLSFASSIEHFLIATTMLVVGVFAVLSWDSMFPSHADVLVLAPLPIRAHTILLAKVAAVASALGLAVITLHVVTGIVWPLALNTDPGGVWTGLRMLFAYWSTMTAASVFVFGLAMSVQGIAASLLPRRHFLRISSMLQLGAFCVVVGVYFLQPMSARPGPSLAAQQHGLLAFSPSYWFLGLFQELSGSPALAPLARRAWLGLGLVIVATVAAYALSYFRTLRRIAEQPDVTPAIARVRWLPAFGDALQTAVVQFSLRTLLRSAPHRVILAFYWGIGFALVIVFLRTPRGQQLTEGAGTWHETSVPLLISSVVMMVFAVLAARLACAMPRDLQANWIFRVVPVQGGPRCETARRRALMTVSVAPVWIGSAGVFLWTWPWQPAVGHLVVLALLGMVLVELSLSGGRKLPFTCSYLPGKSRRQMAGYIAVVLLIPVTITAATVERDALQDPVRYAVVLGMLGIAWIGVRATNAWLRHATGTELEFEDEPAGRLLTLELWDSRTAVQPGVAGVRGESSQK